MSLPKQKITTAGAAILCSKLAFLQLAMIAVFFLKSALADTPTVQTFDSPGSGTWTAPAGVSLVQVEVWGGGGAGGGALKPTGFKNGGGGGGGGGAYARFNAFNATPGNNYSFNVGTNGIGVLTNKGTAGSDSWFVSSATLDALGGTGGGAGIGTSSGAFGIGNGEGIGGVGGAAGSTGDAYFSGGAGTNAPSNGYGGGGGGSAGTLSAGNSAGSNTGTGAVAVTGGGAGGNGGVNSGSVHPTAGSTPGGGGGGYLSNSSSGGTGSSGAPGQIQFTYYPQPTTQASGVTFSSVGSTSMVVSWTPGNGGSSLVIVRAGSPVNAAPLNGIVYSAAPNFGSGSQIGVGNYVVYQGPGNTATLDGLSLGTNYYVAVFAVNGVGTMLAEYLTNEPATGNQVTGSAPSVAAPTQAAIGITTATLGATVTSGSGNAITEYGIVWATTTNLGTASTKIVGGTSGTPPIIYTVNATGLPPAMTIYFAGYAISTAGTGYSLDGSFSTLATAPTIQASSVTISNALYGSFSVSWNRGNGTGCIVLVSSGLPVNSPPVGGTTYTANSAFGSGSQIGTGNYVAYLGAGTNVTLTALTPGMVYNVAVYEWNGSGASVNYLTNSPATGSVILPVYHAGALIISNQPQQFIRLGIDGTLNYWKPGLSNTLAQFAVKNLQAKYVRVSIPDACELTNGIYNPSALSETLGELIAMKAANPNLAFLGTPGTLSDAYSDEQVTNIWGGDVPYCCFPPWIQIWAANGTNSDGTVKWVFQSINDANLTQYLANFVNFMATNGFTINYLDFKNEDNYLQPADLAYVYDNLNALLNPGVPRPLIVAPSGYSEDNSASFISAANPGTYDIASTHNTGGAEDPATFVATVQAASQGYPAKEIWNTELHNWVGTDMGSEVTNSTYLWDHFIAGFNALDTWSFFGPYGDVGQTMLLSDSSDVRTDCKYEIFKQVVNNANGGNYLGVGAGSLSNSVETAAFTNNGIQTVWVLNLTPNPLTNVIFQFSGQDLTGRNLTVSSWYASSTPASNPSYDAEKYGQMTGFVATNTTFNYTLNGQTLYCFRLVSLPAYPGTAITVHGSTNGFQETGGNWQTLDQNNIGNDGHIGSDGYIFFGNFNGNYTSEPAPAFDLYTAKLPVYLTSLVPGTNYGGITENGNYATIDSPLLTNGIEVPAAILWGTGGATTGGQQLLNFTVAGLSLGTVVRVGVMAGVDSATSGGWDPAAITLSEGGTSVTVGNASTAPLTDQPISGEPASCGWVFFDIVNNGTYSLSATLRSGSQSAGIAGLTFDSVVALPPSPQLTATVNGNLLILSWPPNQIGWMLQAQTDSLAAGLGTNWFNVPGSTNGNTVTNPIDPVNGSVFFRLKDGP